MNKNIKLVNGNFDLVKICNLARLKIPQEQFPKLLQEFADLLKLADKVQNPTLANVEPLYHPRDINQVFREDLAKPTPIEEFRDKLLANAPSADNCNFLVPKVIE